MKTDDSTTGRSETRKPELTEQDEARIHQKARDVFGVNHDEVTERYGFFHGAKYATLFERDRPIVRAAADTEWKTEFEQGYNAGRSSATSERIKELEEQVEMLQNEKAHIDDEFIDEMARLQSIFAQLNQVLSWKDDLKKDMTIIKLIKQGKPAEAAFNKPSEFIDEIAGLKDENDKLKVALEAEKGVTKHLSERLADLQMKYEWKSNESMGTMDDNILKQQSKMVDAFGYKQMYPKIEIVQTEFNVYVMRYNSLFDSEELAEFPYGYDLDEDSSEVAVKKAKDFIDLWKLNKHPYDTGTAL